MGIHHYDPADVIHTTRQETMAKFKCPDCPKTFETPQGVGPHRRLTHGYRRDGEARPRGARRSRTAEMSALSETTIVRRYLEWLETPDEPRSRKSPEQIAARLVELDELIATDESSIRRLQSIQERIELRSMLDGGDDTDDDGAELEAAFVTVAAAYGERKGISRAAWREFGVAASVLTEAGIS